MEKLKQKLKNLLSIKYQIKFFVGFVGVSVIASFATIALVNVYRFIEDPVKQGIVSTVTVNRASAEEKVYAYNEQVPVEVVKEEIRKQAKEYGNDVQFMLDLAKCESTFNNLAENPASSAEGIYQFLYGTWRETESGKNHISRFSYKDNIREANIKIANLEYSHWVECLD